MKRSSGKVIKVETQKANGVHKVEKENPFVHFIYHTVFPSFLISTTPIFIICLWYTHAHLGGSFAALLKLFLEGIFFNFIFSFFFSFFLTFFFLFNLTNFNI